MPVDGGVVRTGLTARGNVLGASALQDLLCAPDGLGAVAVDRKQNAPVFDPAFVSLGFIFWNPHSNERAGDSSNCATDARTRQRGHDRTCGDKCSESGDR